MLGAHSEVAVVRTTSYEDISTTREYVAVTDLPAATADAGSEYPTLAKFTAEVIQAAKSQSVLEPGEEIKILQIGGYQDGVAYQVEGDPLIEVGKTYLVFLSDGPGGGEPAYWTLPFGRFEVVDDTLARVESSVPIEQILGGLTTGEAIAVIQQAQ